MVHKEHSEQAVRDRRQFLLRELRKLGISKSFDGRKVEECSLFALEWIHIAEKYKKLNS
ncbi:hypothetical protein [Gracilibacillus alcaliphilus]|uniref:hypothetical protein n=1 Tax=Gracilibacillus alcaliphilus TaxID=1401441 RepID=UPI00195EE72E|nr:hypothetical protein [Gracilibacillus alcaliphilus]MBM7678946.1 hypothetical protein [Gracilibacillus alcaliphilus]